MKLRKLSGVIAVVAAVAAGNVTFADTAAAAPSVPVAPAPVGIKTAPTAALQKFYDQKLVWGNKCAKVKDISCAVLSVPLNYNNPDGETAKIAVVRINAVNKPVGSVVFNPGGPGGSGFSFIDGAYDLLKKESIHNDLQLVSFDPRGVGRSNPLLKCFTDTELDANREKPLSEQSDTDTANRQWAHKCAERTNPVLLKHLGTIDAARDMDILRAALGESKLRYVGVSYGTYLGTLYAEQFPTRVGPMVLDGAIDPSETEQERDKTVDPDQAFVRFGQWCVKSGNCPVGTNPNPKALIKAQQNLLDPLDTAPIKLKDGRLLRANDAYIGVWSALYSQSSWPVLKKALTDLKKRNGELLMSLSDQYQGRNPDGTYNNSSDAYRAILCSDGAKIADCKYWPAAATSHPHRVNLTNLATTPVVISALHDPATPYLDGVALAKQIHGRLITVNSATHGNYLNGNKCVDIPVNRYLETGVLPPANVRC